MTLPKCDQYQNTVMQSASMLRSDVDLCIVGH